MIATGKCSGSSCRACNTLAGIFGVWIFMTITSRGFRVFCRLYCFSPSVRRLVHESPLHSRWKPSSSSSSQSRLLHLLQNPVWTLEDYLLGLKPITLRGWEGGREGGREKRNKTIGGKKGEVNDEEKEESDTQRRRAK